MILFSKKKPRIPIQCKIEYKQLFVRSYYDKMYYVICKKVYTYIKTMFSKTDQTNLIIRFLIPRHPSPQKNITWPVQKMLSRKKNSEFSRVSWIFTYIFILLERGWLFLCYCCFFSQIDKRKFGNLFFVSSWKHVVNRSKALDLTTYSRNYYRQKHCIIMI